MAQRDPMDRPRMAALAVALGMTALLVVYSIGFHAPQGPWILAKEGAVLHLEDGRAGTGFVFGMAGSASHLTGRWYSDAPVLVLYCPLGTECVYLLPKNPGSWGQTIDLYFPPGRYSMGFSAFPPRSANVTFTSDLVYTSLAGPLGSDTVLHGPSNLGCPCTAVA